MYHRVKLNENTYKLTRTIGGKEFTVGVFLNEEQAKDYEWACEMVSSVWCYGGTLEDEYLKKHIEKIGYEAVKREFDWYEQNCTTEYGGTDSEGVSYNTIILKPNREFVEF